jgi:hypothetical protein
VTLYNGGKSGGRSGGRSGGTRGERRKEEVAMKDGREKLKGKR